MGFFDRTDNSDDECTDSGWTVRPSAVRRNDGSDKGPKCGKPVTTTPAGKNAVRINRHTRW